jgi:predicted Zn-dependent protease
MPLHPFLPNRPWPRRRPLLGVLLLAAACARNPVTGRSELALISEHREIEMGREAAEQVEAQIGLLDDDALHAYVRGIGAPLATASERPQLPWRFGVLDDPTANAFSLPGGFVYVTRGLLAYLDSEAELAVVLAHEVAHVTARHAVAAMSRAQLASIGLVVGAILFPPVYQYGGWAGLGLDLLFLQYGRDAEHQADQLALRYAAARGYDPRDTSPAPSWP